MVPHAALKRWSGGNLSGHGWRVALREWGVDDLPCGPWRLGNGPFVAAAKSDLRHRLGLQLNITHVITGLETGGAERFLQRLLLQSRASDVRSCVISLSSLGAIGAALRDSGIPVTALGARGPMSMIPKTARTCPDHWRVRSGHCAELDVPCRCRDRAGAAPLQASAADMECAACARTGKTCHARGHIACRAAIANSARQDHLLRRRGNG